MKAECSVATSGEAKINVTVVPPMGARKMNQWVQFYYINNESLPLMNSNYSELIIIY
jgi:hypothetical protein